MNTTTDFNIQATLVQLVPNVFETMAGVSAHPLPKGDSPPVGDRVCGTIGIAGEAVTGAIYIHLPEALAQMVVNNMLGNPPGQPVSDGDLNDVLGELANMIGGGLKSALCDAGRACGMSTPSIIRGAYSIEVPNELHAEIFHFSCQGLQFATEAHIKFD
ncbi:MAG: chemotaxis protein CheX [Verrucomicrobiota bacterium]